jgi:hypothetical protein
MGEIWVNMLDRALSGWGKAQGRRAIFCIQCDTRAEADGIEAAARDRSEMKHIGISDKPRKPAGAQVTIRHISQMGGDWLKKMDAETKAGVVAKSAARLAQFEGG